MDRRMRWLERRWRASGSPRDEAAWLCARVHTGDLLLDNLRLAAHLGHPPASLALRERATNWEVRGWVRALGRFSKAACVRAAVAAAELVLPDEPPDTEGGAALQAARTWLACPCEPHAQAALHAGEEGWLEIEEFPAFEAARAASGTLRPLDEPGPRFSTPRRARNAVRFAIRLKGEQPVRAVIRDDLIPWSLSNCPNLEVAAEEEAPEPEEEPQSGYDLLVPVVHSKDEVPSPTTRGGWDSCAREGERVSATRR